MNSNIYFDTKEIRKLGSDVIIGKTARIRRPHLAELGSHVVIDDHTYISTRLIMHDYTHISSGCALIGGDRCAVTFEVFSTLAPNVVVAAGSDDYTSGIGTTFLEDSLKGNVQHTDIVFKMFCIVGANTTVLPGAELGIGCAIGANSVVKGKLDDWTLYAGIPAKKIRMRDRDRILYNYERFKSEVKND